MKRLILMRHAKSDWSTAFGSDHDRPLAARGLDACRTLGRFFSRSKTSPDLVLTSSAVRAKSTAERVAALAGWTCEVEVSGELYGCSVDQAMARFREIPDEYSVVIVAGHEPTWSATTSRLVGGGRLRMVTGAIARIDLDCERWSDLESGCGNLGWLLTPKTLAKLATDS